MIRNLNQPSFIGNQTTKKVVNNNMQNQNLSFGIKKQLDGTENLEKQIYTRLTGRNIVNCNGLYSLGMPPVGQTLLLNTENQGNEQIQPQTAILQKVKYVPYQGINTVI